MKEGGARDYAASVRGLIDRMRSRGGGGTDADEEAAMPVTASEALGAAEEAIRVQGGQLRESLDRADRERRRYEALFQDAPAAYLTTDPEGRIRAINMAASRLLSVPSADASGELLPAFVRDAAGVRSRLARLARREPVQDWATELAPRDGGPVPVLVSAAAVDGPDGAVEIRWRLSDVRGERVARERERELQQEQAARAAMARVAERARHLAEMSGRLMGILDPEAVWSTAATMLETQATAVALVELDPEAHGPDLAVRLRGVAGTPAARLELEPLLGRAMEVEAAQEALRIPGGLLTTALRRGNAEAVPASVEPAGEPGNDSGDGAGPCLVVPLRGRDSLLGAMVLWLWPDANVGEEMLVNRHLSDRIALALETAQLFQEVVRARRRAEEAGAAEADFLSMISHELRTPLTAIVSYAELLAERVEDVPEKVRRYALQIAAAAHHQRGLVEQVLSYKGLSRPVTGSDAEELDYRDVANFAVGLVRPQVENRPLTLETHLPPVPVRGTCDAGKLRQILANLLTNALRHTQEGYVRLSLTAEQDWVALRVEDTGEGIPTHELPRIYDRFWRGASARHRPGSGLGLTIVRELVNHMHGEIDVESEPGTGTAFTVRLPRIAPTEAAGA